MGFHAKLDLKMPLTVNTSRYITLVEITALHLLRKRRLGGFSEDSVNLLSKGKALGTRLEIRYCNDCSWFLSHELKY